MSAGPVTGEAIAGLLAKQSPTLVLVVLVWWSMQGMAEDLSSMQASLAILVDRGTNVQVSVTGGDKQDPDPNR